MPFAAFVLFEAALAPVARRAGLGAGPAPAGRVRLGRRRGARRPGRGGADARVPGRGLRWPVGPLRRIKAFLDRELAPALEGCDWPDLALISVAAGVGEEMLFRGVIQGALVPARSAPGRGGRGGRRRCSACSTRSRPPTSSSPASSARTSALVWLVTGNLLAAMVAHAVYDFVALVVLLRPQRGARRRRTTDPADRDRPRKSRAGGDSPWPTRTAAGYAHGTGGTRRPPLATRRTGQSDTGLRPGQSRDERWLTS